MMLAFGNIHVLCLTKEFPRYVRAGVFVSNFVIYFSFVLHVHRVVRGPVQITLRSAYMRSDRVQA